MLNSCQRYRSTVNCSDGCEMKCWRWMTDECTIGWDEIVILARVNAFSEPGMSSFLCFHFDPMVRDSVTVLALTNLKDLVLCLLIDSKKIIEINF